MGVGEFDLIARYFDRPAAGADVRLGIGDDAALVTADAPVVVATSHWQADTAPNTGAAVASSLAAAAAAELRGAGAQPRWLFLNLSLADHDAGWLADFADALHGAAADMGAELLGGDTTRGALAVDLYALGPAAGDAPDAG